MPRLQIQLFVDCGVRRQSRRRWFSYPSGCSFGRDARLQQTRGCCIRSRRIDRQSILTRDSCRPSRVIDRVVAVSRQSQQLRQQAPVCFIVAPAGLPLAREEWTGVLACIENRCDCDFLTNDGCSVPLSPVRNAVS